MTIAEAIEGVRALDELERVRLWWHWMIDHYADNAKCHSSVHHKRHVTLNEFYRQGYPSVNGPEWTAATEYFQYQYMN